MAMRDRLFVDDAGLPGFFARLSKAGIEEAMVVSTCDRVEIMAVRNGEGTLAAILSILGDHAGVSAADIDDQTYTLEGEAAVRHLFSVTGSLDSLVVGEPQILGQIKSSHRYAQEAGCIGLLLDQTLQAAYSMAKRLRRETDIGRRPVSIAAAAVQTARDLHGDLAKCSGLLIGAGEMGEVIAEALLSSGMANLVVTHPSARRAEGLGRRLDCHVADFDELPKLAAKSEIIVTAMSTRHYAVSEDVMVGAIRERRHRPILLIDTGIPGDTEPGIENLDDAFRYTLDDFEHITREGRANREAEAEQAWQILDAELELFLRHSTERQAAPTVKALRERFEEIRDEALRDSDGDAEKATRLLINRLLHEPSETLRTLAAKEAESPSGDWDKTVQALDNLFSLNQAGQDGEDQGR